jgi:hypothetical protein
MPPFPSLFTALLAITHSTFVDARHNGFRHEAVDASQEQLEKRMNPIILNTTDTAQCPASTSARSIYSILYPSPDAAPVEITAQSQVVTSFLPEATWCVGPPIALMPVSGPPYFNQSTEFATITAGTGYCETAYVATETTVCATTLTGIATKVTVTECDQEITFSSECGFTLETPTPTQAAIFNDTLITPAPSVRRLKTFWIAPWQSLTAGNTPSDVDIKVCTILDDDSMECTRYMEVWEVVVVTQTVTTPRDVQLTTTVTGPGTLIVETMEVPVTNTVETVDLSTTMFLEMEVETESISKGTKSHHFSANDFDTEPAESTVYLTKQVYYKSPR